MPQYQFECNKDNGGCGNIIPLECLMSELDNKQPKSCPKCHKRKSIRQVLFPPIAHIPCTLGSLAEKNTASKSDDERHHLTEKFNEYKKPTAPSWVDTDNGIVHT